MDTVGVIDAEVERVQELPAGALVRTDSQLAIAPVMDVATAMARLRQFQTYVQGYLKESKDGGNDGGDYGILPGTAKKTLLKSGADKLCEVYGLADHYEVTSRVEDWDRGLFDYELRCILKSRRDDSVVGTGVGSCSSFESKYRWRMAQRRCPNCGKDAIIKGKKEYDRTGGDGGWICFARKGGCGEKFADDEPRILRQDVGRVENPDIIDTKNTVLKMAKKRAKIDAVISVTRSAGLFTQDLEDHQPTDEVEVQRVEPAKPSQTQQPAESQPQRSIPPSNGNGQPPAQPRSTGADRVISPAQCKRLFAIARENGVSMDDVKAHIKAEYGYRDDTEIRRSDYEAICAFAGQSQQN